MVGRRRAVLRGPLRSASAPRTASGAPVHRLDAGRALYRLYNGGMTGVPNHRFVTSLAIYNDFTTNRGWSPEGVRFCASEIVIF